jgi:hypothetical protein
LNEIACKIASLVNKLRTPNINRFAITPYDLRNEKGKKSIDILTE